MSTQGTVRDWHRSRFGHVPRSELIVRVAKKVLEEAAELYAAVRSGDQSAIRRECADVGVTVYAMAYLIPIDLEAEIGARVSELWSRTEDQEARDRARGL